MTSVERTLAALRGERVDRVPNMHLIKQFCTRQLDIRFTDYNRDYRVLVDAQLRMHDRWGFDCFNTTGYPYREAGDCGLPLEWRDEAVPHALDVPVKDRKDIEALTWPDPWDGPLMRDRLNAIRLFKRERPEVTVLGWVEGCFAQAATFRGLNQLMMDLVLEPEVVWELMDFCLPMETAFARAQVEAGADIIGIGDSAASLVRRDHYAEFILPYEHKLIEAIHGMGAPTKLHICGDITRLLPDMATLPVRMVDVDWMVDLKEARAVLGPEVCLWGNFDPVRVLLQGAPEQVREACRRCIRESGPRYVLSAGCEVPPDTPAENFAAACEVYEQVSV